jgi:hypothetical protein
VRSILAAICCAGWLVMLPPALAHGEEPLDKATGPIPMVNPAPLQLLFLQAPPDQARTLPRGASRIRLSTSLTNTLLQEDQGPVAGIIDMEMLRTQIDFSYGLSDRLELGLSLPLAYSSGGFMDAMILDAEQAFGNARKVREEESAGQYHFDIRRHGRCIFGSDDHATGSGDLAVRLKTLIFPEGEWRPAAAARVGLKLPTGRSSQELGSGGTDMGVGLLLEKHFGPLGGYFNADAIFPGSVNSDDPQMDTQTFYQTMFGLAYRLTPAFCANLQLGYTSRPFSGTGLSMLDRRIVDLLLGLTYYGTNGFFVQAGTMEDIFDSVDAGADISFFLNLGRQF